MNRAWEGTMRKLIPLANCEDGNCPGIDQWTDTRDFQIRGYRVAAEDKPAGLPAEEDVVMIPCDVLLSLIAQLQQRLARQPA
jgi:hypothetical protein